MNGSASADIIAAAYMVAEAKNISANAEINEEEFFKGPHTFLVLAAEMGALIASGKLDPVRDKAHGKLVEHFELWLKAHDPNRELVGNSITLMQCVEYLDVILPALKGQVPEVNLNYFN